MPIVSKTDVRKAQYASVGDLAVLNSHAEARKAIEGFCTQYVRNELKRKLEAMHQENKSDPYIAKCEENKESILQNMVRRHQREFIINGKTISDQQLNTTKMNFIAHCNDVTAQVLVEAVLKCRKSEGSLKENYFTCGTLRKYIEKSFQEIFGNQL